ncbi:uncharacterized protein F4807DRAFT_464161 [Annulohypoxylon truncatum]|uniref:uncharacterized protein n=1 Tax=Annulohypoxylon truncatum TaxID=327061 RepID=UPI0020073179|nr:uncharacterized protein F4807DRAFT_464161 [Annulohypoxylon truncatum]KAI1205930.1 hypothetical protein F4807DRAFT_464161 [Annulohypoxylon truncatum]
MGQSDYQALPVDSQSSPTPPGLPGHDNNNQLVHHGHSHDDDRSAHYRHNAIRNGVADDIVPNRNYGSSARNTGNKNKIGQVGRGHLGTNEGDENNITQLSDRLSNQHSNQFPTLVMILVALGLALGLALSFSRLWS